MEVPPIVPQLVPQSFLRVQMATVGRRSLDLRGSTGGGGAPPTPSGPPHRGTPPGQGGTDILAAGTLADVVVVDVPVNMQHKFQQSLVLHSVHQQSGGYSSCYTETGMHSVVVQKTVEIPLPFRGTTSFGTDSAGKLWNCRRCRSCGVVDVTVIIQLVSAVQSYVSRAIQSDRVPDIPVMPTVQFLYKVVDMVLRQLPTVQTVHSSCVRRQGRRHPWFRTVEEPQIQSSTEFNDDFEAGLGAFFGEFCAIFRTPPRGGESRGARIFRALDDEEFFVVEGSPGWRGK